jgi:hypothetical protein
MTYKSYIISLKGMLLHAEAVAITNKSGARFAEIMRPVLGFTKLNFTDSASYAG